MRRGHLNAEAPLGLLGETHSVGRRKNFSAGYVHLGQLLIDLHPTAPTISPEAPELPQHIGPPVTSYRPDTRMQQQQQFFDFDLDLNPDL